MNSTTKVKVEVKNFGGGEEIVKTHPSFVMAQFSRVTGGSGKLFGSELRNDHFIRFTLTSAEEIWRLSQKWYHGGIRPLVEVDMSAAQFAELITTLNMGSGVPTTLREIKGERVPEFEDNDTLQKQIKEDLKSHGDEVLKDADLLEEKIKEEKLPKKRKEELLRLISRLKRQMKENMPFIIDQYKEAVDNVTANAKTELDAFVTHTVTQLGIDSLKQLKS